MVQRLSLLHRDNILIKKKNVRLVEKLEELIDKRGIVLDSETSSDFTQIMMEEEHQVLKKYAPDSFQRVFWQQQKKAASVKDKKGMTVNDQILYISKTSVQQSIWNTSPL